MKALALLLVWEGGEMTVGELISPLVEATVWQGGSRMCCLALFASGTLHHQGSSTRTLLAHPLLKYSFGLTALRQLN